MTEIATDPEQLVKENTVLVEAAREHYDDTLLVYHSFEYHILANVWPTARKLASVAINSGHQIDLAALDAMCVYHDADEHKPLQKRFKTRERRAASIARKEVPQLHLGYTDAQVRLISNGIITTTAGIRPTTKEGAILKRADGFNAGSNVSEFLENSRRMVREQRNLERIGLEPDDLERWKDIACTILRSNLDCDPNIEGFTIPEIEEFETSFIDRGLVNIAALASVGVDTMTGWLHKI